MESSIASDLLCPRTRDRRVPDDYAPPYPCWSARASTSVGQVVMGYFGVQWASSERLEDGIGYFREILSPRVEHYETMFNTPDRLEGIGMVMGGISGDIQEHGYWGSARDRIPLAQTDALSPSGNLRVLSGTPAHGQRVRIAGHDNVAIVYHEVSVLKSEEQEYEYINCHPNTGLLNAVTQD